MRNKESPAQKFCRIARVNRGDKDTCIELMEALSNATSRDVGEKLLVELGDITGKSMKEIMTLLKFSCPACPE